MKRESSPLPPGWIMATLADVATVYQGQSPPGTTYNTDGVGLPFLQGSAEFGERHPTPVKWCAAPVRIAAPGDILISIRAPVGSTNVADQTYCIGRGLAAVRVSDPIDPIFVLHQIRHTVSTLVDQSAGTTFDAIGGGVLREHTLAIAPSREQQRIVEALESYLSGLDAAITNLEAAMRKLKAYRASVLKAAVEGRLVPTEAELVRKEARSYEPADALLDRILTERRRRWEEAELAKLKAAGKTPTDDRWKAKYSEPEPPDVDNLPSLPDGWCWTRLDAVCDVQLGQQRAPIHAAASEQLPYIRAANITWDGLDLSDLKTMGFPNPDRYRLMFGDVLLSEASGSPMEAGKPAIWRDEVPGACYQKTLLRVRGIARGTLLPEYLRLVFLRDCVTGKFAAAAPGVGIVHLTAERMVAWPIPIPPVAEQERIVDEFERLETVRNAARATVENETRRIHRLRQSVLAWAFEGKLVDQDPADESADAVLARIHAERAVAPVAQRQQKCSQKLKAAS